MENKSGDILKNSVDDSEIESKVGYIFVRKILNIYCVTFYMYVFVGNIKEEDANEIRSTPVVESGIGSM